MTTLEHHTTDFAALRGSLETGEESGGACIDITMPIVGAVIFKQFGKSVYRGVVLYVYRSGLAAESNWFHIAYDDGDHEDLTISELAELLMEMEQRKWVALPTCEI
tara:strand:+ start:325 stop:642 length:318 start_codon:yes stop_codon:yes gene_type:complete